MKDAIVAEMREIRQEIEREFDHDTDRYLEHLYKAQEAHGDRLVRREPKPLKVRKVV